MDSPLTDPLLTTYNEAYKFLERMVGRERLDQELNYYLGNKPDSLEAVFKQMVGSLKNKQGWSNFIASVDDMAATLEDFDPHRVYEKYAGDHDRLFLDFEALFGDRYTFDITNKRNSWLMYSKGVLSSAAFLSSYKNFQAFDTFVTSFSFNEYAVAALPMVLEKEIFGFGFPLACDFLKEIGYASYGKPDVHLKDILVGLELVSIDSDYEVFKAIVRTAILAKTEAAIVDKVYWIIGSGKLEVAPQQSLGRLKKTFISEVKPILEKQRLNNKVW
jgi:hypothetical protein